MAQHASAFAGVMFSLLCVSVMASSALDAATQSARSIAGVQKVINMLEDMSATAKKEKNDEEIAFGKFTVWCKQETASLKREIKQNGETIALLEAQIDKLTQDVAALGEAIEKLDANVAKYNADVKSETAQREKDHAAFLEEEKDYSESVDALDRAIAVLSKQDYDRPALVQLSEDDRLPAKAQSVVTALLGMAGENSDPDYQAPEANAYENQSGGVIEMLEKLQTEFADKKSQLDSEEMNAQHAFEAIMQQLADNIENANHEVSKKKDIAAETQQLKAETEGDLAATTSERKDRKSVV